MSEFCKGFGIKPAASHFLGAGERQEDCYYSDCFCCSGTVAGGPAFMGALEGIYDIRGHRKKGHMGPCDRKKASARLFTVR